MGSFDLLFPEPLGQPWNLLFFMFGVGLLLNAGYQFVSDNDPSLQVIILGALFLTFGVAESLPSLATRKAGWIRLVSALLAILLLIIL